MLVYNDAIYNITDFFNLHMKYSAMANEFSAT